VAAKVLAFRGKKTRREFYARESVNDGGALLPNGRGIRMLVAFLSISKLLDLIVF